MSQVTVTRRTESTGTKEWLAPFFLAVPFITIVSGYFTFPDFLPLPVALLVAAGWAVVLGLIGTWVRSKVVLGAWVEDIFVALAIVAVAFLGCGGLMWLLTISAALDSSSLTGQTLITMFLPSIPFYIIANTPMELLIVPGLVYVGWRPGKRRILIVTTAVMYFVLRVWTYLGYVPHRVAFSKLEGSARVLTEVERQQAYLDLKLDDPRWAYLLVMLVVLLLAAALPRVRELTRA